MRGRVNLDRQLVALLKLAREVLVAQNLLIRVNVAVVLVIQFINLIFERFDKLGFRDLLLEQLGYLILLRILDFLQPFVELLLDFFSVRRKLHVI